MKFFWLFTALVWCGLLAFAAIVGTVGGIHDNIQFKDWFSVTMWAIFGPLIFAMGVAGCVVCGRKLERLSPG